MASSPTYLRQFESNSPIWATEVKRTRDGSPTVQPISSRRYSDLSNGMNRIHFVGHAVHVNWRSVMHNMTYRRRRVANGNAMAANTNTDEGSGIVEICWIENASTATVPMVAVTVNR